MYPHNKHVLNAAMLQIAIDLRSPVRDDIALLVNRNGGVLAAPNARGLITQRILSIVGSIYRQRRVGVLNVGGHFALRRFLRAPTRR